MRHSEGAVVQAIVCTTQYNWECLKVDDNMDVS